MAAKISGSQNKNHLSSTKPSAIAAVCNGASTGVLADPLLRFWSFFFENAIGFFFGPGCRYSVGCYQLMAGWQRYPAAAAAATVAVAAAAAPSHGNCKAHVLSVRDVLFTLF